MRRFVEGVDRGQATLFPLFLSRPKQLQGAALGSGCSSTFGLSSTRGLMKLSISVSWNDNKTVALNWTCFWTLSWVVACWSSMTTL
jgi:hypothetical protein